MPTASLPWASMDEEARTEFWATLALRHAQGLGPRSCARLLQTFGSAYKAMQNMGQWAEAGVSAEKKAQVQSGSWRTTARQEWDDAQSLDAHILLWHDPYYPPLLRQLADAPPLLYYKGDISLLRSPAVAIVGSRHCTEDGIKMASAIARQLSACGISIVSGMALGIDSAAHRLALREVGKSIAVLGTGIDVIYPQANAHVYTALSSEGLLVSEFAPGVRGIPTNFPVRNRIISGLSLGVLVVEAALRSGSLITARLALEQNREVYAIPGPMFSKQSEGCQSLIRQGARVIFSAEDMVIDLATQLENFGIRDADVTVQSLEGALADDDAPVLPEAPSPPQRLRAKKGQGAKVTRVGLKHEESTALEHCMSADTEGLATELCLPELKGDALRIVTYLQTHGKVHADSLCAALDLAAENVSSTLIELEISKHVLRLPGAWYCIHGVK